jgi:hypothetical protein
LPSTGPVIYFAGGSLTNLLEDRYQELVESNTSMTVSKFSNELGLKIEPAEVLADPVDDHEVVSEAVHFRKV